MLGDPFGRVRRLCHRPKHLKLLLHVERAPFLPRVHDHLPGFIVQLEPSFADIPLRIVSWTLPFLFQTTSRTIFDCLCVSRVLSRRDNSRSWKISATNPSELGFVV